MVVPHGECEHAAQTFERRRSPARPGLHQHFRVGPRAKRHARGFELPANLAEIVNLAVEDNRATVVGAGHRLAAARQVDDRKAAVPQADLRSREKAFAVRAPVGEAQRHALEESAVNSGNRSRDSTHIFIFTGKHCCRMNRDCDVAGASALREFPL